MAGPSSARADELHGLRVLVVDDHKEARELFERILGNSGAIVVMASSVDEALAAFDATPPDVVVSDIGMPVVDGYELNKLLRKRSGGGRTPYRVDRLHPFGGSDARVTRRLFGAPLQAD